MISNNDKELFKYWDFELDTFQKEGIRALSKNENIFIAVPTGSGKTVLAEYAIRKSISEGKKCIYTSPIKSVSNQKFFEFTRKYPDLSIGILTGDIKFNLDADVIIMTTEILRNLIYKGNDKNLQDKLEIDIDLSEDVDCVVFDEVHYLNDEDRGKVWEESIVLLPNHINLVMLSATVNNSQEIVDWIQDIKQKPIHLIKKNDRVVPLKHYMFYSSRYNKSKDNDIAKMVNKNSNKLVEFISEKCVFDEMAYCMIKKAKSTNFKSKNSYRNKIVSIQNLIKILDGKKLLPALFFVFSRNKCEQYAYGINKCLNTPQEQSEVERIIDSSIHKLKNKHLYYRTKEYHDLVSILTKGVGYHHSGMRTIHKEIVEILYSKGLIKVLFATETFAVGINCPVKTVVFTALEKYSNKGLRYINTSEYLQMAGRAGRRGLDKTGTVILLTNMFELPETVTARSITCSGQQDIKSRFNMNYQFVLKMILNEMEFSEFFKKTLLYNQCNQERDGLLQMIERQEKYINNFPQTNEKTETFDEFYMLMGKEDKTKQEKNRIKRTKKKKEFMKDYNQYLIKYEENDKLAHMKYEYDNYSFFTETELNVIMSFLEENGYISQNGKITMKGIVGSKVSECNEILMTEIVMSGILDGLKAEEIVGLLGVFSNTKSLDEADRIYNVDDLDIPINLKRAVKKLEKIRDDKQNNELRNNIYIDIDWSLNLETVEYAYKWAKGTTFDNLYYGNYMGNFIKDILKLSNIIATVELICQIKGDMLLYNKLITTHIMILRDNVSNESLYIRM